VSSALAPVALREALAGVFTPRPLANILGAWRLLHEREFPLDEHALAQVLDSELPAGPLREVLRDKLAEWDHAGDAEGQWSAGTAPNSPERRERVYELLQIGSELETVVRSALAPHIQDLRPVVIERGGYERWYTPERQLNSFYWQRYKRHLREIKGWKPENVEALGSATAAVVERLADPSRILPRQTKGLVVGHVQSGKTANLTGVIARAADAGYRLIIVLTGLTDLLRNQTQRRVDMELTGQEIIRPDGVGSTDEDVDYLHDPEWSSFISYGGRPSILGAFDWIRLTGERWDYRRLKAGIETLQFQRIRPSDPFFAQENLAHAPAKIMVIKKHSGRMQNVIRDLERVKSHSRLADVPALIIDDESDQASVNTAKPTLDADDRRRSTINKWVVDLLELLPRSQYVGYTATPFANVLIDAEDATDLFPRDFIISLSPPVEYLGAKDFHDLDGLPPKAAREPFLSNERCFVRSIVGTDDAIANLPQAIDSFVLSGAVKLWRQSQGFGVFRHHTMLIHSSQLTAEHSRLQFLASSIFDDNGYESPEAMDRLEALWNKDHLAVARARALPEVTPAWGDLKSFIGKAVGEIRGSAGPVIVVNGTDQGSDPDFDRQAVWKIVVGGAKLSRGYTIEGLTVSYFRRRATAGDALMQMGRWFGYRTGYQDLVRLYVSREEQVGQRTFDLYEAFEAACRDEELFRSQLRRYALESPEDEPIRPVDVPPLVYSHLEWLPPVAKNKRLNARITFENLGGQWREPTMAPTEAQRIAANSELFADVMGHIDLVSVRAKTALGEFTAWVGEMEAGEMLRILERYRWAADYGTAQTRRILEFLRGREGHDPDVSSWLVLAPQLETAAQVPPWRVADRAFTVKRRARVSPDGVRVKAYSEPVHRLAAEELVGKKPMYDGSGLQALANPKRGVMLFYPTHHLSRGEAAPPGFVPTMGFALLFPSNSLPQRLTFVTRTGDDAAFVDASTSED
jgi:hypothetical protein